MSAGFPVKADYATGDVLSAANMNDLSGTLNYIDPTGKTNGYVLTRNSSATGGLEWAAVGGGGGGGKVLQVVMGTTSTAVTVSSTTLTDTGLTATITPTASTSKILVLASQIYYTYRASLGATGNYALFRGTTNILNNSNAFAFGVEGTSGSFESGGIVGVSYLDSPATTSATTYKLQGRCYGATDVVFQRSSNTSTIILLEIGA